MGTCAHCGYESRGTATCPLCGGRMLETDAAVESAEPAGRPPWEDPSVPFPANLVSTWTRSLTRPTELFRGVPYDEAAARPMLYYLIVTAVAALFSLWWEAVMAGSATPWMQELGLVSPETTAGTALLGFFLAPFAALAWLAVWSLLLHLFVTFLVREGRRGLRATVRAVCYAAGPGLLVIVPFLGPIAGGIWTLALTAIGVREAHRSSGGAAAAAVILAILTPLFLVFALFVLLVVAGAIVR